MLAVVCPVFQSTLPPAGEVVAVKVADCPVQIVGEFIEIVGVGATVVVIEAVLVHPCGFVTVTVNVPAVFIEATSLFPKPLFQE
jgi:hypothetical protein